METKEKIRKINLVKVVDYLLKSLSDRERTILLKRYGLEGDKKHTLEQIGKSYKITRERVRQIENNSIKKLKDLDSVTKKKSRFDDANEYLYNLIAANGGVMEESSMVGKLQKLHQKTHQDILQRLVSFILDNLVENINQVKGNEKRHTSWRLDTVKEELIDEIVETVIGIIQDHNDPLSDKDLLKTFEQTDFFQSNKEAILSLCDLNKDGELTLHEIFVAYLQIIKKVRKNIFEKWGLTSWKNVQPKKINDKAYLVLKKAEKPMHFSDITTLINKAKFDEKIACPATVHNELILNDQYVLVGRGIYALKEWGYKEGTVIDVIYNILEKTGKPMTKDDIVSAVLETRMVKKSTIYLSLLNKNRFKKVGLNEYAIK